MQIAKGLFTPIQPDNVLSPDVYYGNELTGIYFETNDDQFGRITFDNLDSIKVSRGEYLPYPDDWDWQSDAPYCWLTVVENSEWLKQRHAYEAKHYGSSYEFGGNVDEMLTDFHHYIFSFHDQFIEVIARGLWFEKSPNNLINQPLSADHPAQPLPQLKTTHFSAHGLTSFVRINPIDIEILQQNTLFHKQKLFEFRLDSDDNNHADHWVIIERRDQQIMTKFIGYFGNTITIFDQIPTLEQITPYLEKYMQEVAARRRSG